MGDHWLTEQFLDSSAVFCSGDFDRRRMYRYSDRYPPFAVIDLSMACASGHGGDRVNLLFAVLMALGDLSQRSLDLWDQLKKRWAVFGADGSAGMAILSMD